MNWIDGLNNEVVERQRRRFGKNRLDKDYEFKIIKIFLRQLVSPLIYVLITALGITYLLHEYGNSLMILVAVLTNTILGFVQEYRAEKGLEALVSILALRVEVFRDNKRVKVSVEELVVGDIVFLSDEHRVPADGVIMEEDGLFMDESILTGESVGMEKYDFLSTNDWRERPIDEVIEKGRKEFDQIEEKYKAYAGARVEVGVGNMLVLRVGRETQIGQVAHALKKEKESETPLQRQITMLSKQLAWLVGLISILVLMVGLGVGQSFKEIFPVTVALAVAAIPEGLVISMTVILAIGMRRILKQRAVVKSLAAVETLGSVDVVCADKTGTLTEGIMKVTQAVVSLEKATQKKIDEMIKAAILCNDLRDPLEIAMDKWAREKGKDLREIDSPVHRRIDSIPFNHKNSYIATLLADGVVYLSGAPEVVLKRSLLKENDIESWTKKLQELGGEGYRLVGFAKKNLGTEKLKEKDLENLEWLGVLVYEDPVRIGIKEMVEEIKKIGVSVKVITGDHKDTAMAILKQIGMLSEDEWSKVIVGDELDKMSDESLLSKIDETVLFARVKPQQKLRIVEALKKMGHIVAMTGDGVNDALALKQADIGIVVNQASDVAKESADVILLENNFATIVKIIEEGRGIFENLRKVVVYLLSDAFAGILLVIASLIFRWPLPLLAAQILWINLISDGLPSMALTIEPYDPLILKGKIDRDKKLLDIRSLWLVGLTSALTALLTGTLFGWSRFFMFHSLEVSRTVAFAMLGMASLTYVFSTRSLNHHIWKVSFFRNKLLILAVLAGLLLQLLAIYTPQLQILLGTTVIGWKEWVLILMGCGLLITTIEGVKFATSKKQ